jgi:hypothetical protein
MAALSALVASAAVVLGLWLGLSGPETSPVDAPAGAGQGDNVGNGRNGGGGR